MLYIRIDCATNLVITDQPTCDIVSLFPTAQSTFEFIYQGKEGLTHGKSLVGTLMITQSHLHQITDILLLAVVGTLLLT